MNRCSPVVRVANFFLSEGFVKGDSVAVFMANRPEFVCVWLGLAKIGTYRTEPGTSLLWRNW